MNKVDMSALSQFDELPASAHVRLPVVSALFGISTATVWRWSKSGHLPAPVHINGVTMWNVAALRSHMPSVPTSGGAALGAPTAQAKDETSEE